MKDKALSDEHVLLALLGDERVGADVMRKEKLSFEKLSAAIETARGGGDA